MMKTRVCEQTGSMNKTHYSAAATNFSLVNHQSLIYIHCCQIRFRSSSMFYFHPQLPNFISSIIQVWFSSTSAKFKNIAHPRSKSITNRNQINHAWKVNHGYQCLDKSRHNTRKVNEDPFFFVFFIFQQTITFVLFLNKSSHIWGWQSFTDSRLQ